MWPSDADDQRGPDPDAHQIVSSSGVRKGGAGRIVTEPPMDDIEHAEA